MVSPFISANLLSVITAREIPSITFWNRLEGRPRADKFDRARRAVDADAAVAAW